MNQGPRVDGACLEEFLCGYFGVENVMQINPMQGMAESWRVMTEHTAVVEVGSVPKPSHGERHVFQFDPANTDHESQAVHCMLGDSSLVRILTDVVPTSRDTWFKHPRSGEPMEPDPERACIYEIVTRHMWSSVRCPIALRVGFQHSGLNALYGLDEQSKLVEDSGGLRNCYTTVSQTPEAGIDVHEEAHARAQNFANAHFTSTMALVTEDNLLNCTVIVPDTICRAAKFPEFAPVDPPHAQLEEFLMKKHQEQNPDASQDQLRAAVMEEWQRKAYESRDIHPTHYVAVPINHVLAWGLRDLGFIELRLHAYVHAFKYKPGANPYGIDPRRPIVLYYMVNNVTFDALVDDFKRSWLGRVDERPLRSLSWDLVPVIERDKYTRDQCRGVMTARSHITYMMPPRLTPQQQQQIMPALHPDFPSFRLWQPYTAMERAAMSAAGK